MTISREWYRGGVDVQRLMFFLGEDRIVGHEIVLF